MVMISPVMTTMNSAPAESRSSRTGTMWPVGAPRLLGSVENEYCVFAMHTGKWPKPTASSSLKRASTRAVAGDVGGAIDLGRDRLDLVAQAHARRGRAA